MDMLSWIILIAAIIIGCGIATWKIVQIIRMSPEQRKEVIKQWLVSAVVAAENAIKESGAGQEKMAMVKNYFKTKAPLTYKIMMRITDSAELEDLINKALNMVKDNFESSK